MAKAKRRGAHRKHNYDHIDNLGVWTELLTEKLYGTDDEGYSSKDILLRQEFKRAMKGERRAVRSMMELLEAATELERDTREWSSSDLISGPAARAPDNDELALLLLGIGAIDNRSLEWAPEPGSLHHDDFMRKLKVTRLEKWVLKAAPKKPGDPQLSARDKLVYATFAPANKRDCSKWYANKKRIMADLMRLKGPKDTRFKPGVSGNRKGRPVRKRGGVPVEDFFMQPVPFTVAGETRTLTRLDALMQQLVMMATKDEKIARLIMPTVIALQKAEWAAVQPELDETFRA